jgi:hypothetical protein
LPVSAEWYCRDIRSARAPSAAHYDGNATGIVGNQTESVNGQLHSLAVVVPYRQRQ